MAASNLSADLVSRLDECLPQTQCTRCGYPSCRDYARAMADGRADINRCPPGGDATLQALSSTLSVPAKPLAPECGEHTARTRAVIDESICIGCRKCIDACPVDAIVGARKLMHTVITSECTGCELCVPPCPVDCIDMVPVNSNTLDPRSSWREYTHAETTRWRMRTEARRRRLERRKTRTARQTPSTNSIFPDRDTIRADIRAALDRARLKKVTPPGK